MNDKSKVKKSDWGIFFPPAVGYHLNVLCNLIWNNKVSFRYYPRVVLLCIANLFNAPFRFFEQILINRRLKIKTPDQAPLFILGHWRSGTTHLHNLLCTPPNAAYVTTYQSVFPDTLFIKFGKIFFLNMMKLLMPGTRKADNVKLGTALPQEDGFMIGNAVPLAYYYFWYFPKNADRFYIEAVEFKVDKNKIKRFFENYKLIIQKAVKNTGGKRFISKNPVNTARIKILSEQFPGAKFIHIYRNPVEVFLSTKRFFMQVLPSLQLQKFSEKEIDDLIFRMFKKIMQKYLDERTEIPKHQLVEVDFYDLENKPLEVLENIYRQLNLSGFEKDKTYFTEYLKHRKNYKKNTYRIKRSLLERILREWDFAMKAWNYDIPENVEIIE